MASREEIERAYEEGKGTSHYDGLKAVYRLGRDSVGQGEQVGQAEPTGAAQELRQGYYNADEPEAPKKKGKK
jgi:hypothetical protein